MRRLFLLIPFLTTFLTLQPASAGMVAFFDKTDRVCPEGWRPLDNARGRLLRGTIDPNRVGSIQGTPMQDKAAPKHQHPLSVHFVSLSKKVVAVQELWPWKQNHGVADGEANWSQTGGPYITGQSDGNIPYVQMLACEEVGATAAQNMRNEMVAFFNDRACPANWELYRNLHNRFIVPVPDDVEAGEFNRVVDGTSQGHDHSIAMVEGIAGANQVGVNPTNIGMEASDVGILIKEKNGWAKKQSPVRSISANKSTDTKIVPSIDLLACRKVTGRARVKALPEYMLAFMSAENCPTGWREKSATHGRFIVGLPSGQHAKSGTTFGGPPLANGEVRTHNHAVNISFYWGSRPFVGFTGSTNTGFAAAGTYNLTGTTQQAAIHMPYVQMRHCVARNQTNDGSSGINQ